jgi:hypothetical protein
MTSSVTPLYEVVAGKRISLVRDRASLGTVVYLIVAILSLHIAQVTSATVSQRASATTPRSTGISTDHRTMSHPAFENAGTAAGLKIWRIEVSILKTIIYFPFQEQAPYKE